MERKVIVVCAVVGFLGVLSAVLAFAGEGTKLKLSDIQLTDAGYCVYPKSAALYLGMFSALFLLIAQIIINSVAGCFCCKRRGDHSSGSKQTVALICFIVSWVTFVLGFLVLLGAAALNDENYNNNLSYNYCVVVKGGVFSTGAILSLSTVVLGLAYYILLDSSKNIPILPTNQGVAMGVAHVPPQGADPVFVHEDTYNRRQFT
ncbi:hypothetical protein LUZ60_009495 [Juncus effusus]|nr:hypothetical protein LUZ60_009495 [Juncus effusus]